MHAWGKHDEFQNHLRQPLPGGLDAILLRFYAPY